jgi:hypothetical protein
VDRSRTDIHEVILTTTWYIWWIRRQKVHGENVQAISQAVMSIQVLVANFTRARVHAAKGRTSKWCRAPDGFVTINVDAGYDANLGSGATGAVIRDDKGHFVAASNQKLSSVLDTTIAEATAVLHGLYLANLMGVHKLLIQSDNLEVINMLNDRGFSGTAAAPIFEDILVQSISFTKVCFVHCPRDVNLVAHCLAKNCDSQPNVWVDDPPSFILSLLIDDVAVI